MTKGFVVCHAHIGLTKLNINLRRKKETRLLCVMLLVLVIPTGYLINVEWPIGNDAEDKRGCQGVQIIIGKPIANSAPNPLGPYCQNLGELYQRQYTCTYLQALKCEVYG